MATPISKQELVNASTDAGTLGEFINGGKGATNINRAGNDVSNLATITADIRDTSLVAAGVTPYELAADIPPSGNAPGSRARVWGDTAENNGYYTADSAGIYTRDDPQPANQGDVDELQVTIATTLGLSVDSAEYIKVVIGPDQRIYVWLDHGLIDAMGFGPRLANETQRIAVDRMSQYVGIDEDSSQFARIVQGEDGRVYVWLADGLLDAAGFGPGLVEIIRNIAAIDTASMTPKVQPRDLPLRTDGSSLRRWLAKLGRVKGGAEQARILLTGDSWTEHLTIAEALTDVLFGSFGRAGTGWLSLDPQYYLDGVTGSRSGSWTLYDASVDQAPPTMGCGPDGHALYSTTAGDTLTLGNLVHGNQLTVFFGAQSGSFRYQVDGGAWTTVTPSASGAAVQTTIVALSSGTAHSITLEVLSGTVALFGFLLRDTAAVGVELLKVGNGGTTGSDWMQFAQEWIAPFASVLDADVTLQILGTNDYRSARGSVATFKAAHESIISAYRSVHADCGNIVMVPMQSNATAVIPLVQYRDAAWEVANDQQAEFVNGYDAWADYATENALTQWRDSLHISTGGAHRLVRQLLLPVLGV